MKTFLPFCFNIVKITSLGRISSCIKLYRIASQQPISMIMKRKIIPKILSAKLKFDSPLSFPIDNPFKNKQKMTKVSILKNTITSLWHITLTFWEACLLDFFVLGDYDVCSSVFPLVLLYRSLQYSLASCFK